jgi:hypothetical protein
VEHFKLGHYPKPEEGGSGERNQNVTGEDAAADNSRAGSVCEHLSVNA